MARNGKFRSPGKKGSWCYMANRISLAQAKCNNASKIEHALKYERDQWPTYTTLLNASQSAEWTFSFERERRANTQVESFHGSFKSQTRSAERFTSLVYEATNPLIRPVYTRINIQRGKGIVETNSLRGPSPSIRRARKNRIDTTLKHTQILEILKIPKIIFESIRQIQFPFFHFISHLIFFISFLSFLSILHLQNLLQTNSQTRDLSTTPIKSCRRNIEKFFFRERKKENLPKRKSHRTIARPGAFFRSLNADDVGQTKRSPRQGWAKSDPAIADLGAFRIGRGDEGGGGWTLFHGEAAFSGDTSTRN